ncbi:aldo/keto reductase [Tenggerimyces flavus]|uniref:Aldo/keto reductase n=1 Tax=Tenggerimyces flavus TaxID=1708749 RepID=A0ABV7Y3X3_9ACTN|nr:aldo/keto reductase [Tenggerimyces flavus]MBM7788467.1 aryl-alcohol dehydrogenase-like predicted oxidoreductase [Tenggerimyces flavus]
MATTTPLTTYHLLGRTGLRVSPLALGAMTFGVDGSEGAGIWGGWGSNEETSRAVFQRYVEAGGNFVDTAVNYAQGRSEELLGKFVEESGTRDRLVLATKFTMSTEQGNPNASGNGRKNLIASLDASLRRLRTDYVDLYWMHSWDTMTPVEEVMSTFDALVRSGKVRAIGLSNVPAWYVAKAQLTARANGWEPVAALQLEYSLVARDIERELVPAALDLGAAVVPWSPLASGFLAGKYERTAEGATGEGRLEALKAFSFAQDRPEQHWNTLDVLKKVASEVGRTPAQVALNWVAQRPGVVSTLIGARTVEQLDDNLAALDFALSAEQRGLLDEVSAWKSRDLADSELARQVMNGGTDVRQEPAWFRGAVSA